RQGLEQDRIHNGEQGRSGPDAQGQNEDRGQGVQRTMAEGTEGVEPRLHRGIYCGNRKKFGAWVTLATFFGAALALPRQAPANLRGTFASMGSIGNWACGRICNMPGECCGGNAG